MAQLKECEPENGPLKSEEASSDDQVAKEKKEVERLANLAKRQAIRENSKEVSDGTSEDTLEEDSINDNGLDLLESRFDELLVDVLDDCLPVLMQRLARSHSDRELKTQEQREVEAKTAENDAMIRLRLGEKGPNGNTRAEQPKRSIPSHNRKSKPLFGLLKLKILECLRALVVHFSVPSSSDSHTRRFFDLLCNVKFATIALVRCIGLEREMIHSSHPQETLIDRPRMDIVHSILVQTIKTIIGKDKIRFYLSAV